MIVALVLFVGSTLSFSLSFIEAGHVGIQRLFGEIKPLVLHEGMNFHSPFVNVSERSIQRQFLELTSEDNNDLNIEVISSDKLKLTIDMTFPYVIEGQSYPELLRRVGTRGLDNLVLSSARSSVREAAAEFQWSEIAVTKKQDFMSRTMQLFDFYLTADLTQVGIVKSGMSNPIKVITPQLRNVLPPNEISLSISQRLAAEEDLKKQETLTEIAKEEANRRLNEGKGISNLFDQLPKGFGAQEINAVLSAIADKTRADAMLRAVENGSVQVMVMGQGASPAVSLPAITASPN
jgi:regulator of protease activity HflC (stomatin/prohibitin superfamily)